MTDRLLLQFPQRRRPASVQAVECTLDHRAEWNIVRVAFRPQGAAARTEIQDLLKLLGPDRLVFLKQSSTPFQGFPAKLELSVRGQVAERSDR